MKFNAITIVFVILSLSIGYYLNTLANERNNKKLIAAFKAELEAINQTKTRTNNTLERAQIELKEAELRGKIACLESQL